VPARLPNVVKKLKNSLYDFFHFVDHGGPVGGGVFGFFFVVVGLGDGEFCAVFAGFDFVGYLKVVFRLIFYPLQLLK
jgi:hypothetical protein